MTVLKQYNTGTGTWETIVSGSQGAQGTPGTLFNYTINPQTTTTYTFVGTDASALVTLSNTSSITVTVPTNASVGLPVGTQLNIIQINTGQVTVVGASGVTVASSAATSNSPKLRGQYSAASLIKADTNTWYVVGDIA